MLNDLIRETAFGTGVSEQSARKALGVVLQASDRQGTLLAKTVFEQMPDRTDARWTTVHDRDHVFAFA